jgi:hypothetical protein
LAVAVGAALKVLAGRVLSPDLALAGQKVPDKTRLHHAVAAALDTGLGIIIPAVMAVAAWCGSNTPLCIIKG